MTNTKKGARRSLLEPSCDRLLRGQTLLPDEDILIEALEQVEGRGQPGVLSDCESSVTRLGEPFGDCDQSIICPRRDPPRAGWEEDP